MRTRGKVTIALMVSTLLLAGTTAGADSRRKPRQDVRRQSQEERAYYDQMRWQNQYQRNHDERMRRAEENARLEAQRYSESLGNDVAPMFPYGW